MYFDCLLSGAQVRGDLFVQLAGYDVFEHFTFARCERGEARTNLGKFGLLPARDAIPFDRSANGCEQIFILNRLDKEINRAAFHRLHGTWNIAATSEKNNGQRTAFFVERLLEFKTIKARHHKIKHEAAWHVRIVLHKKFLGRRESDYRETRRTQQTGEGSSHRRFVVHHKHNGAGESTHLISVMGVSGLRPPPAG